MTTAVLKHSYNAADYDSVADYSAEPARSIILRDMQRTSLFQKLFGNTGYTLLKYDAALFPFGKLVLDMMFEKKLLPARLHNVTLSNLHQHIGEELTELDGSGINEVSRRFYERSEKFEAMYRLFVEYLGDEFIGKDCLFQKFSTMRVYFPHAKGFNWRPNYHCDIMLGHPPQEINVWVPLTDVFGSNSIRIATLADSIELLKRYDFNFREFLAALQTDDALQDELLKRTSVVEAKIGDVLLFDSRCLHVLQNNKTNATRVSMDTRLVPVREYEALEMNYRGTGRRQMPFAIGEYYSQQILRIKG
jgi:hypothetical protein